MANRVLLGNRGSEYGLFVSKPGVDVTSTSATGGMAFDSNAIESPRVVGYGQGILSPRTTGDLTYSEAKAIYTGASSASHVVRVSHGLSYAPLIFIRWSYGGDLSSSKAARTYNMGHVCSEYAVFQFSFGGAFYYIDSTIGMGLKAEVDTSYLYIASMESGAQDNSFGTTSNKYNGVNIYYAYVITDGADKGVFL
tara:strand:- start:17 stop:601 length:585 start_codon:yes stop_codon:yes gene_type:complete